ncbi:MAG: hypothetical protein R3D67_15055 [Hyphomicrobiaceae bacterium]
MPRRPGWLAWISDESQLLAWNSGAWIAVSSGAASINPAPLVGVNATADTTNRLAVSSPASLFNHAPGRWPPAEDQQGNGRRYGQRCFFRPTFPAAPGSSGLAGDDDWHVKVSPDGAFGTKP